MVITKMDESSGSAVGYRFSGAITKDDYGVLVPEMAQLVRANGDVQILCDLAEFTAERPSAWLADLHFGREFHTNISKMAIVGEKHWEKWIAELAAPLYAREARYFHNADEAWEWLRAPSDQVS
jgi:hypothetical protein